MPFIAAHVVEQALNLPDAKTVQFLQDQVKTMENCVDAINNERSRGKGLSPTAESMRKRLGKAFERYEDVCEKNNLTPIKDVLDLVVDEKVGHSITLLNAISKQASYLTTIKSKDLELKQDKNLQAHEKGVYSYEIPRVEKLLKDLKREQEENTKSIDSFLEKYEGKCTPLTTEYFEKKSLYYQNLSTSENSVNKDRGTSVAQGPAQGMPSNARRGREGVSIG